MSITPHIDDIESEEVIQTTSKIIILMAVFAIIIAFALVLGNTVLFLYDTPPPSIIYEPVEKV